MILLDEYTSNNIYIFPLAAGVQVGGLVENRQFEMILVMYLIAIHVQAIIAMMIMIGMRIPSTTPTENGKGNMHINITYLDSQPTEFQIIFDDLPIIHAGSLLCGHTMLLSVYDMV